MMKYLLKDEMVERFENSEELIKWLLKTDERVDIAIQNYEEVYNNYIDLELEINFEEFINNGFKPTEKEIEDFKNGKLIRVYVIKSNGDSKSFLTENVDKIIRDVVEFLDEDADIEVE